MNTIAMAILFLGSLYGVFSCTYLFRKKKLFMFLLLPFQLMMLYGCIALSSYAFAPFLVPSNYIWPLSNHDELIYLSSGNVAIKQSVSGKIQVFNAHGVYQFGWYVTGRPRKFDLLYSNKLNVIVVRTLYEIHAYTENGNSVDVSVSPHEIDSNVSHQAPFKIKTPWYLYPLTNRLYAFACLICGLLGAVSIVRREIEGSRRKSGG